MDPLSITASVLAVINLTSEVISYLNNVKDASKDRAQCAIEASNLYSLLVALRFRLDASVDEPWHTAVRNLGVQNGPLEQYKSSLEQLQLRLTGGTMVKRMADALRWNFSKEEVTRILTRMERLKTLVQVALEMDHFKLSQAIKTTIDTIQESQDAIKNDMTLLQHSVNTLQIGHHRQQTNKVLEWLSPTDFPAQQSDIIARRQEGTGMWFLESPKFVRWVKQPKQTLFCPGIPGAGKTMISAIVVDHLLGSLQSDTVGVAYIYCNYKAQADQTATSLLAAILKQLVQANPFTAEPLTQLNNRHVTQQTRPSLKEVSDTLRSVIAQHSAVYLVVDGLDECLDTDGTRGELVRQLRTTQSNADVHAIVTSRFIPAIVNEFVQTPMLEVRASDADVKQFVSGQIDRLPLCVRRDAELQDTVQNRIVEAVDGMFLLARLHVDSLLDKRTKAKIRSTLENLTRGSQALDEAYDEAIQRIQSQLPDDSALAKRVLTWITLAERVLETDELCNALAVERGDKELDRDNIPDVEDVVSVCAGLVTVDEESNIIRLVHNTTQEYFDRVLEDWNPSAQQDIASICLTHLSFDSFRRKHWPSEGEIHEMIQQHAFLLYAAQCWSYHALPVQEDVSELALRLLRDDRLVYCALRFAPPPVGITPMGPGRARGATGLHLTAYYELTRLSKLLLQGSDTDPEIPVNSRNLHKETPLLWAVRHGCEASVGLLLESDDIEADSRDGRGRTPLWWAAKEAPERFLRMILGRNDVDINSKNHCHETPLFGAAQSGRETVVKLLLEQTCIDANSRELGGATPLNEAARNGHLAVVRVLLERADVEVNLKDYLGCTPLHWAVRNGHQAVVSLLLERDDIDPDSRGERGQTPLAIAVMRGIKTIVNLLLARKDVDVNVKDDRGRTPLSWGAEGRPVTGRDNWVSRAEGEFDEDSGSEVEAESEAESEAETESEVEERSDAEDEAQAKLLLDREDIDVNLKDEDGRTPLSWGAEAGSVAVVKLLLARKDIDVDPKDEDGRTPLTWAAVAGSTDVVMLLLDREDAEVDSTDENGRTPLSWASSWSAAAARLLIARKDVNADSKDENGRTPLFWAADGGCEAVVELLLCRPDVTVDAKGNGGQTPLSRAAEKGHEAVVKLLLAWEDVDIDTTDEKGRTPLSLAVERRHQAVVELLQDEVMCRNLWQSRHLRRLS